MASVEEAISELQSILDNLETVTTTMTAADEALRAPQEQTDAAEEAMPELAAAAEAAIGQLEELAEVTAALSLTDTAEHVAATRETVEQAHGQLETISEALNRHAVGLGAIRASLPEMIGQLGAACELLGQAQLRLTSITTGAPAGSGASRADTGLSGPQLLGPLPANAPSTTRPSHPPDPDRKPQGTPEAPEGDARKIRGIERQNAAAGLLATLGYAVEFDPPPRENGRRPDFIIEGNWWVPLYLSRGV